MTRQKKRKILEIFFAKRTRLRLAKYLILFNKAIGFSVRCAELSFRKVELSAKKI